MYKAAVGGFCLLFIFSFSLVASADDACEGVTDWQKIALTEDSLLIGLLRVNGRPLSSGFDIYQYEDRFLVPMEGLNELLGMGWDVDQSALQISSKKTHSADEFCQFSIDLSGDQNTQGLVWGQDDFDIYLDMRVLPRLLGGSATFMYELQQLQILTPSLIPNLATTGTIDVPSFTASTTLEPDAIVQDQYWLATPPLLNYRLNGSYQDDEPGLKTNLGVNAFFDIAKHAAEFRINRNANDTKQFLRLSRNVGLENGSASSHALRYEIGDLQLQSDELVMRAKQAAGFSIYNFDANYTRSFSQLTITETVLPEWRAQLFRNGQFIEERFADDTNRVVFEGVDSFYGTNLFEIKLYGPEGQQEVRTQTVNVGNEQLAPGKLRYQVTASNARIRVIDNDLNESQYDQSLTGLLSYGVNSSTTLEASAYQLKGRGSRQNYLSSALYFNFESMAFKTQLVKDLEAGEAFFAGINANIQGALRANLTTRIFHDFSSDAYQQDRGIQSESRLRLNGRSDLGGGIGWNASVLYREFRERKNASVINVGINKNLLGGTFSTSLTYNSQSSDQRLLNRIYWSKNISGYQFSNSLEWLPENQQKIRNYYTNIRWPQKYQMFNESRLEYRANQQDKFSFSHRFNLRKDEFNFQVAATVDDGGHWRMNLGISGDIEYNPFSGDLDFYRPRGGNVANIHAFAYLDNNRNNQFDEEDSALSDVLISGNQKWRGHGTNDQGQVQLATTSRRQSLHIDEASLPDPFMQPAQKLVMVDTHPGGVNRVELPVVTFTDIEGAIYRVKGQSSRGASGISLSIIDEQQSVVADTVTEIDGYFYVANLAPGTYYLQIDPDYLAKNQLAVANQPEFIHAPKLGDTIRINDVLLIQHGPEPTPKRTINHNHIPKAGFFAQLGAFKKPRSIIEVIKHLPTEKYDLRIYRNHTTALSHVVLGGYDTYQEAQEAISQLSEHMIFEDTYINQTDRYRSSQWTLEYELLNLDQHIQYGLQTVREANTNSYFCIMASYRSQTSIKPSLLNDLKRIFAARRVVNGQRYYSVFFGPVNAPQDCKTQMDMPKLSAQKPFAISQSTLASQWLAPL
ncbi:SPOR domain-containing protein [Aliiglaciecola litoralis]|uniref:SPOR domain-containing protein n=1 Tax=Aliiglaciecola litoralis TaxID=582857 RepID=A0ABP3WPP9_9ALTE